jgi:membrane protein
MDSRHRWNPGLVAVLRAVGHVTKRSLVDVLADKGFTHAAAIAYYAVVSLFPLFLLLISAVGFFLKGDFQQQVLALGSQYLPDSSLKFVRENIIAVVESRDSLTLFGLLGLVWSASLMFDAINEAVNAAWGVTHPERFLVSKLKSITMVFALLLFVIVSVAWTTQAAVFERFGSLLLGYPFGDWLWAVGNHAFFLLGRAISVILTILAFTIAYLYLPRLEVSLGDVAVGAIGAGMCWELSKQAFVWYITTVADYSKVYGSISAVLILLIWAHLSALILIWGAELASEYSKYRRKRSELSPAKLVVSESRG